MTPSTMARLGLLTAPARGWRDRSRGSMGIGAIIGSASGADPSGPSWEPSYSLVGGGPYRSDFCPTIWPAQFGNLDQGGFQAIVEDAILSAEPRNFIQERIMGTRQIVEGYAKAFTVIGQRRRLKGLVTMGLSLIVPSFHAPHYT